LDRRTRPPGRSRPAISSRLSSTMLNELRIGDTRRMVGRTAAPLDGTPSAILGLPGIPSSAHFPDTLPTSLIAGYQQLGSPPNTGSEFGTGVTQIADSVTWARDDSPSKWVPICGGSDSMCCSRHRRRGPSPSAACSRISPGLPARGRHWRAFSWARFSCSQSICRAGADQESSPLVNDWSVIGVV
jgi:hypothetical protein